MNSGFSSRKHSSNRIPRSLILRYSRRVSRTDGGVSCFCLFLFFSKLCYYFLRHIRRSSRLKKKKDDWLVMIQQSPQIGPEFCLVE